MSKINRRGNDGHGMHGLPREDDHLVDPDEQSVYYNPERFGLTLVGEADPGVPYEFDTFAVWRRDSDGALLWGADAGTDLARPFEDHRVGDLHVGALRTVLAKLASWVGDAASLDYAARKESADLLRDRLASS